MVNTVNGVAAVNVGSAMYENSELEEEYVLELEEIETDTVSDDDAGGERQVSVDAS